MKCNKPWSVNNLDGTKTKGNFGEVCEYFKWVRNSLELGTLHLCCSLSLKDVTGVVGGTKLFSDTDMTKTHRTPKKSTRLLMVKEGIWGIPLLGSHGVFCSCHWKLAMPGNFYAGEHQTHHWKRFCSPPVIVLASALYETMTSSPLLNPSYHYCFNSTYLRLEVNILPSLYILFRLLEFKHMMNIIGYIMWKRRKFFLILALCYLSDKSLPVFVLTWMNYYWCLDFISYPDGFIC